MLVNSRLMYTTRSRVDMYHQNGVWRGLGFGFYRGFRS